MAKIPAGLNLQPGEELRIWEEISEHPDRISNYRKLARTLERKNRFTEAIIVLRQAGKKIPAERDRESLEVAKQAARLYESSQDDRAAVREYRKLIRRYPGELVLYERLERIFTRQGRKPEMVKIYRAVEKGSPQRERALKRVVRLETDLKNYGAGRQELKKLIREFGPDYTRLKDLGRLYEKSGNLKAAVAWYKKALKLKPRNPDLEQLIGVSTRKTGRRKLARETFREILNHTPGWYGAHIQLAEMDIEDGRLESAEKHLKSIDRRFPGNSRVAINRARILLAEAKPQEALALVRPAAVSTPFYYTDELSLGHQVQADAHRALENQEEAGYHSLLAVRIKGCPDYFQTVIALVDELIGSGDLKLADQAAEGLLERYPVNSLARIKKAEIARLQGRLDEAIASAAQAAGESNPAYLRDKLRGLELLAELYEMKGLGEKARDCRRRICDLEPGIQPGK